MFPGSNAIHTRVFNPFDLRRIDFLTRSGRAVVLPVYKGTYHRGGELLSGDKVNSTVLTFGTGIEVGVFQDYYRILASHFALHLCPTSRNLLVKANPNFVRTGE